MNVDRIAIVAASVWICVFLAGAQVRPGNDSLIQAIQQSDLEAERRTIEAGADVNAAHKSGATPLMHAALYSTAACIRLLLDKSADPNMANKAGATALMWSEGTALTLASEAPAIASR